MVKTNWMAFRSQLFGDNCNKQTVDYKLPVKKIHNIKTQLEKM